MEKYEKRRNGRRTEVVLRLTDEKFEMANFLDLDK